MSSLVCTMDANGNSSCGTGGWTGPRPGDPNTSNMLIHATPAFGGIDVTWNYPDLNPEAVAYTKLYRSLLPSTDSATLHRAAVQGSFFYDPLNDDTSTVYYYWIQVVSVYGTISEMIGPAWATAKPLIEQMIEKLTGQIDAGVLAQSLKSEIARIELNKLAITQEMLDRDAADDALGVYVNTIEAHSGETRALLQEEVLARTSQGEAFVSTVNTVYATLNGNIAAVQTTVTALVTEVDALAEQITNVESEFNGNLAQVQTTLQTNINTVNGKVVSIGALWTAQVNVNGLIGGFGVYNDGNTVEAGFDVDRFWIGRTGANKRKPFIIDAGVVYIDEAAINKLTFSKLRDESGSFIVESGKVKANYIQADQLEVQWAKIQNISVATGHIQNLAVDTLKIKGNAVTVPSTVSNSTTYSGGGINAWMPIVALTFDMDQPGYIQAFFGCVQAFGSGIRQFQFRMFINGTQVQGGGGDWADVFPSLQAAVFVGAGAHNVSVEWWGENAGVAISQSNLFTIGAKR